MEKVLKNSIADIKFSLNRLVRSHAAQEQTQSLFLLERALELVQQAEDHTEVSPHHADNDISNMAMVQSLMNSDSRFHLN